MNTNTIESKILTKAEKQARADVQHFQKSIAAIDLADDFKMKCHTGEFKSISAIVAYYLQENTINYDAVLSARTQTYVERYTNDLLSNMQHLKEFLERDLN